jgi:hypothetical protein
MRGSAILWIQGMSQYEKLNIINKDEYEVYEINQLPTQKPCAK